MLPRAPLLAIILISVMLSGCAALKAEPSQGAGFVPMETMAKQGDLPFNKAWVKQGMNWKDYQAIYIRPVNTTYLMETDSWKEKLPPGPYERRCAGDRPLHGRSLQSGLCQ